MGLKALRVPLPSRPKLPGGNWRPHNETRIPEAVEPARDEFGLNNEVFGRYPKACRRYVAIALRHFGLPFDVTPKGFATIPELVMVGMLLDRGFQSQTINSNRSFNFQSHELGGRQPGGAVVDVAVYYGGEAIAVRVQSAFHGLDFPFGTGGAKFEEDQRQRARLWSHGLFDRVVDVNRPEDGGPLENGSEALLNREFDRVLGRL